MEKAKHTPGPWFAEELDLGWSVFHESGIAAICRVHGGVTNDAGIDAAKENARLIAAAPRLLAACKEFQWAEFDEFENDYVCPCCDGLKREGHKPDCHLAAAIAAAERGE